MALAPNMFPAEPFPASGWTVGLDFTLEGSASLRGGAAQGQALHSLALANLSWSQSGRSDSDVYFHAYASVLNLAGRGPTERYLGDFLAASNMEGFASTRLYSWWGEARFGHWSLRAGALLADDEFTGTEVGGHFFNSAFGWPAFISANTVNTGPAFFVAAPGFRLERRLGKNASGRFGFFDGDSFDSASGDPHATRHGLHYRVGGGQGWFAIGEATYEPAESANRYKAGVWLHTADFADVRDDATGRRVAATGADPSLHSRNYGAYASVERTLAGKIGEAGHLAAFVRAGVAPPNRNALSWALDSGFAITGLIPGRAEDVTAFGLAHARFSPRFIAHARAADPSVAEPDFEQTIEVSHRIEISRHFTLQPDLQYIRHPGGSAAQHNALVILLRLNASY